MTPKVRYLLHLADNPLILGQRLGEWCGHGPVLEQDIVLTNTALDLIGQSRMIYQYIAGFEDVRSDEDKLSMLRFEHEYFNLLLVEQPNRDFGFTIVRQFLYDAFNLLQYQTLSAHPDETLRAIAIKTMKEIKYHYRYSSEWVTRLGDGTEKSKMIIQQALDELWRFTGEMFEPASYEQALMESGYSIDVMSLKAPWLEIVNEVLTKAGLNTPHAARMLTGGKEGKHTEHFGYILTELQYMQRTYPQMQW